MYGAREGAAVTVFANNPPPFNPHAYEDALWADTLAAQRHLEDVLFFHGRAAALLAQAEQAIALGRWAEAGALQAQVERMCQRGEQGLDEAEGLLL